MLKYFKDLDKQNNQHRIEKLCKNKQKLNIQYDRLKIIQGTKEIMGKGRVGLGTYDSYILYICINSIKPSHI